MTEQERPRTEAGQSILDVIGEAVGYPVSENEAWQRRVRRIEVEGRQQAVREAKEQLRPPPHLIGYSVVCEVLDRVAGLNASESPPTNRLFEAVRQVIREGIDTPGVRNELHAAFYEARDASESGRRGDNVVTGSAALTSNAGDTAGWADVRDASESPPPTTDIECDCGHGLQAHYGTSEGDRLPQPCSVNDCNCDDFVETERDASESGQPPDQIDSGGEPLQ